MDKVLAIRCWLPCVVLLLLGSAKVWSQEGRTVPRGRGATEASDPAELIVRVYPVADLVQPVRHYPFRGLIVPGTQPNLRLPGPVGTLDSPVPSGTSGGMGGMGGGMGGMGGGGMGGGGFFAVPGQPPVLRQIGGDGTPTGGEGAAGTGDAAPPANLASPRLTVDELEDALMTTIAPDTWAEVGGPASLHHVGGLLVISQTAMVHRQIQDLLEQLRIAAPARRTVTLQVTWLVMPGEGPESALPETDAADGTRIVDPAWLAAQHAAGQNQGRIRCLDGQTVHLVAGAFRNVLVGLIPVVGGEASGYQPTIANQGLGALLQATPSILPDQDAVLLDLQSVVTRGLPDEPLALAVHDGTELDRVPLVGQQFMSTVRIPCRQPVVVAGGTLQPLTADGDRQQLYLVVEATCSVSP